MAPIETSKRQKGPIMKTVRNTLMLGACALLAPSVAMAQTAPPSPAAAAPASSATTSATTSAPAGAATAAPAAATSTASITAGTKVLDTAGNTAGMIESVDGDYVVLATAKSKVRLPKTSFAMAASGPVIAMTAAQIDAAAAQAAPAAQAAAAKPNVAAGAAVGDTQGGSVGTVASVDGQVATVTLAGGGKVRLPVSAFAAGSDGGLKIAMTAAQLKAAAGAAK